MNESNFFEDEEGPLKTNGVISIYFPLTHRRAFFKAVKQHRPNENMEYLGTTVLFNPRLNSNSFQACNVFITTSETAGCPRLDIYFKPTDNPEAPDHRLLDTEIAIIADFLFCVKDHYDAKNIQTHMVFYIQGEDEAQKLVLLDALQRMNIDARELHLNPNQELHQALEVVGLNMRTPSEQAPIAYPHI